ncbi:unnamed protein product [Penicillium pancosmium]
MAPIVHSQLDEQSAPNSSPPSSPGSSSDKENPRRRTINKRSKAQMAPPSHDKRRRLTDRTSNIHSQIPSSQRVGKNKFYDPDQDINERRKVRRDLRDLTREFNDSRGEFLQSGNDGIVKTVTQLNHLYTKVKQTSDATLDSRLLVNAADLSHKKTAQLAVGESGAGIDVDEFVSKCISYMRRGLESTITPTQRRRHRQSQRDPNASDGEDDGDAMNWDWLGRKACLPFSSRPTVSGFLLGPLSVEKRTRQFTQRKATERPDPSQLVRPNDLVQEDLGQEDNNLTVMCSTIGKLLSDTQVQRQQQVQAELENEYGEDAPAEALQATMDKYDVCDDGGIPLFKFCINPHSFGQSVENLFYVSFLARDGHAGISTDSRQIPTLHSANPYQPSEAQQKGIQKHQAIFSLDFDTWREIIDVFDIKESIIPHREEIEEASGTWQ